LIFYTLDDKEERKRLQTMCVKEIKVFGLFGKIDLEFGSYLILIENVTNIDTLLGAGIFRVDSLIFVPVHKSELTDPLAIEEGDKASIAMINELQKTQAFYFSYDIDLTKNL